MRSLSGTPPDPLEDTRPSWMKNNETARAEINHDAKKYFYTVLKKEAGPQELPGFLGVFEGHYFISEEAQEKFRQPQLLHEIIEFTELKEQKGRCLGALQRELQTVHDELRPAYIEYRRTFFQNLVAYSEKTRGQDREFIKEISASLQYLQLYQIKPENLHGEIDTGSSVGKEKW